MARLRTWLVRGLAVLLLLPILIVGVVLAGANTGPGRRAIMALVPPLSGDIVRIEGLSGRFPDALRATRIQVSDASGSYVTITDLALDWRPLRLFRGEAAIDSLTAAAVAFERLPQSPGGSNGGSDGGGGFVLPVRVSLAHLHVARFEIGADLAGRRATLSVDGSATVDSLQQGQARLALTAGADRYDLDAAIGPAGLRGTLTVREQAGGLLAGVAALPDLGAIAADITVDGPLTALRATLFLTAGPLRANASGTLDAQALTADLAVSATAPAMTPRPDLGWRGITLDGRVTGPLTAPQGNGTLTIDALTAGDARIGSLRAGFNGNAGQMDIRGTLDGVTLPGPAPDLFARAPVQAELSARLGEAGRPVGFSIRHTLFSADGSVRTDGALTASATLRIPDLAPFAGIGGADLKGSTELTLDATRTGATTDLALRGTIGVTGGIAPVPSVVGGAGAIDIAVSVIGSDVTLHHARFDGAGASLSASGGLARDVLSLDWAATVADAAVIQPTISGPLAAKGRVAGPLDDLTLAADLTGDIAAQGIRSGHVAVRLDASGLPNDPRGRLTAQGTLLDAPVSLAVTADRQDGALRVTIDPSTWKSLTAEGALTLPPGALIPIGSVKLAMLRLDDLAPLLGRPVSGRVSATLDIDAARAPLRAEARQAGLPGTAMVAGTEIALDVRDPMGTLSLDGSLRLDGAGVSGLRVGGRMTARGTLDALSVDIQSDIQGLPSGPARLATAAILNLGARTIAVNTLRADWRQQTLRLLAPARITLADDITIDRLRLGFRQAELSVAGRVGATMDLTAALRGLPADIGTLFDPAYAADGTITAEARLTGSSAAPAGTVRVTGTGLRLRQGPGRALPSANLSVAATLDGRQARIDAQATMGSSRLGATGTVPLSATGAMNLRTRGTVDLVMTDPLLAAQGRRLRGRVEIDAAVTGSPLDPRAAGTVQLVNGDVQDFGMGVRIAAISATIQGDGDTVRLTRFTGTAGAGTIDASGTVGLPGTMPVALRLSARNARPLSSDLLTAVLDAELTLNGAALGEGLALGGTVTVRHADIRIPERMPTAIATIPVRIAGSTAPPPPKARPAPPVALALTLDAPGQIFVRGRGVDAELGGKVVFAGTAANPQPTGGLTLRRGTFSLAGQTITFTEGTIDFTGGGLANPALRLVATSVSPTMTARLTLSGSARNPAIALSSTPELPQDEVLAQLLFNTSTARLSAFQIAQIAGALATLGGGPSILADPLGGIRGALGLDRLTVGTGTNGAPTLEAGTYLAPGVYLGARQSASGGGTQATIQVDITKGLKLEATAGAGSASATGSAGATDGASVGVTYQFEY